MKTTYHKNFIGTPFYIDVSEIDNGPDILPSLKVRVSKRNDTNDIIVCEYIRNHPTFGTNTFYPFKVNNEWFALYSANYTTTRVMKIFDNTVVDWCGLDNNFCPTEFYIPCYNKFIFNTVEVYSVDSTYLSPESFVETQESDNFVESKYCTFGFVSGYTEDDTDNWKLRYIDLSKILEKEINITEKFRYWPLPVNQTLTQCINMSRWEPGHEWIELTRSEHINLITGERC